MIHSEWGPDWQALFGYAKVHGRYDSRFLIICNRSKYRFTFIARSPHRLFRSPSLMNDSVSLSQMHEPLLLHDIAATRVVRQLNVNHVNIQIFVIYRRID